MIIDSKVESYTQISVPGHPISPLKSFTLQLGKQNQNNRFALFESNRREVDKMRSDGFISKKDQLKTKGEFGVGAEEGSVKAGVG